MSLSSLDRHGRKRRPSLPAASGAIAGVAAVFGIAPAAAQTVSNVEAEAMVLASDNPFLLPGGDNGALGAEVRLSPEITWTLPPATSVEFAGSAAYRRYSRRYGDFVTGDVRATIDHRENEYVSFMTSASVARDLPVDALTESIDFTADSRTVRERLAARAQVTWTPDSRTTVTGGGSWEETRYPGSDILSSNTSYQADVTVSRRLSPTTTVGLAARGTETRLPGPGDGSATGVFATINRRFGPYVQADAQLGVEWTRFDLGGGTRARISGSGNLCYRPGLTDLCLNASLQNEVSGFTGLQREFHAGLIGRRQLGAYGELAGRAEYRRAEIEALGLQSDAMRLNLTYSRRVAEHVSVFGGVDYLARKFLNASRNDSVMVRIGITLERLG